MSISVMCTIGDKNWGLWISHLPYNLSAFLDFNNPNW